MSIEEIDRGFIEEARRVSPLDFLYNACSGIPIKVSGKGTHISVSKILRADKTASGVWVACNWFGEGIGDNISLVQSLIPGTHFLDAIEMLTGVRPALGMTAPRFKKRRRSSVSKESIMPKIKIPEWDTNNEKGRAWLRNRGISNQAISIAEKNGGLKYTPNGVAYIGYNDYGSIKYLALRYFVNQIDPEDGSEFNKKDAYGSLKRYPFCILPEDNHSPYKAYIVEGGTNALAALDFALDKGQNVFIMTTGGVAIREWQENKTLMEKLKNAEKVFLIGENETEGTYHTAEEKQKMTNTIRDKIINELKEKDIIAKRINVPEEYEDMADYRLAFIQKNSIPRMEEDKKFIFADKDNNNKDNDVPPIRKIRKGFKHIPLTP